MWKSTSFGGVEDRSMSLDRSWVVGNRIASRFKISSISTDSSPSSPTTQILGGAYQSASAPGTAAPFSLTLMGRSSSSMENQRLQFFKCFLHLNLNLQLIIHCQEICTSKPIFVFFGINIYFFWLLINREIVSLHRIRLLSP